MFKSFIGALANGNTNSFDVGFKTLSVENKKIKILNPLKRLYWFFFFFNHWQIAVVEEELKYLMEKKNISGSDS